MAMIRRLAMLAVLSAVALWQTPAMLTPCAGALQALAVLAAQERSLPPGHYCTPKPPKRSKVAHACNCHRVDIDPSCEGPAHDPQCLVYCREEATQCRCPVKCTGGEG